MDLALSLMEKTNIMFEIIFIILIMPFFWFGFGLMLPTIGLIRLRDKMIGYDPHNGNEGSMIEFGIYQVIASIISIGFFTWLYSNCSLVAFSFSILIWCMWCLINAFILYVSRN